MSARLKAVVPSAAIEALESAIEIAEAGQSWATDRIVPMIAALGALADFSTEQADKANGRLELIHSVAKELRVLLDDADSYFGTELRILREKLASAEGGAA